MHLDAEAHVAKAVAVAQNIRGFRVRLTAVRGLVIAVRQEETSADLDRRTRDRSLNEKAFELWQARRRLDRDDVVNAIAVRLLLFLLAGPDQHVGNAET